VPAAFLQRAGPASRLPNSAGAVPHSVTVCEKLIEIVMPGLHPSSIQSGKENPCQRLANLRRRIEERITSRTRAVIPVHLFGLPCEMEPILALARRYGLQVIEDSAETMFAHYHGRAVGSFGELGCFSTYVAHLLVGGVGGLVTTRDDELAEMCRSLMAHGRDQIYLNIEDDDQIADAALEQMVRRRFRFIRVGYSYRMTELEAAIALSELEHWEEIIAKRRHNAAQLTALLKPFAEYLQLPTIPLGFEHSFMMYPLVVREPLDRDDLLLCLERRGIETRYLFPFLLYLSL